MQALHTLSVFFVASLLLALTPGPDNLFVLAQAAQQGKRAGIVVTLGLTTGIMFHTLAVAFGAAAIFSTSVVVFNALKYVGASYLLYLAYQAWKASGRVGEQAEAERLSWRRLYGRGVVMNITNPKVALFFLAFLPQFTDPALGSLFPQFLLLGLLFVVSTLLVFGAISLLAGWIGGYLRSSQRPARLLNCSAAMVFLALAVKLALVKR
ncbi:LysE family translocator [Desulforhopalus sp. IMCC35007]|uniref:LysE family translocator n=1 Tax=Desulforhopalus sp. IMCC35007 TaxID=2569543 RepID=UPI0010AEA1FF|nr:LysE family translocator [Desulforhopalus sp. IMCC35007]TKB09877.1 LysE family translocator [Desulforhopalus sp. IMCC35007]